MDHFHARKVSGKPVLAAWLAAGLLLLGLQGCDLLDGQAAMTVLVYIDADNNLDSYGLENLNQMETVNLWASDVNVIVLIDRAAYSDWSDTRLYKVEYDLGGLDNSAIVSTRLSSGPLGISATGSTELDMGDPETLRNFVTWAKAAYPSKEYALVLWDHGSGWRSQKLQAGASRALASDDTSDSIMYTAQLGEALDDGGLDVIAFDLCYGGMLEVAYELRAKAGWMVGSEETIPGAGYPYDAWLTAFAAAPSKDADTLCSTLVQAYGEYYNSTSPGVTLAAYDLGRTDALMTAFNSFAATLDAAMTGATVQAAVKRVLFNDVEDYYTGGSDIGIDIYDMADRIANDAATAGLAPSQAAALKTAVTDFVVYETHSDLASDYYSDGNADSHGVAVHLTVCNQWRTDSAENREDLAYFADHAALQTLYDAGQLPAVLDSGSWRFQAPATHVPAFVDATGNAWVPNLTGASGLLYKVFYASLD